MPSFGCLAICGPYLPAQESNGGELRKAVFGKDLSKIPKATADLEGYMYIYTV